MDSLMNVTMGDMLDKTASFYPDHDAVVYTDRPYRRTYAEFAAETDLVARGLMALGINKGDKVAIWATNHQQWLINMFATAKIGAIMVTVNTSYKIFEVEYLLKQSDSSTLVMMESYRDINYVDIINQLNPDLKNSEPGKSVFKKLPHLKNVIYFGENKTPAGMFNWDQLYEFAKEVGEDELAARKATLDPHDVINMQYTSGTTGYPKGVMLTHYNISNNGSSIADCMKFSEKDRLCIPVPFFHCFGMVLAITACVSHGAAMIPIEYFNALKVMEAIQKEKCTAVHGVPTMFIAMLEHPQFSEFDFSTMRTGIMAGSPCPIKVMQQVVDDMHMSEITSVYGLTESSPGCTQTRVNDSLEKRVSSVGKPLPFVECRIVDPETGETLPENVPGEFMARGYNIMKGYYKMPEATAQAITEDGWLHSGDIATLDEDGYYHITGRLKDMIIRGGENIYPKEIEEFLYTNPKISDVQVIAIPSRKYGEEVMAYVILKEGEQASEDELKDFCMASLARHKCPKHIRTIDAFPMTASGKIQKFKLREMAVEELNLQDEDNIPTA